MSGITPKTRRTVLLRDECCCAGCGLAVGYEDGDRIQIVTLYSIHHRRPRKMGSTPDPAYNRPANLLTLCGTGTTGCHGRVEREREWAYERGLLVHDWDDPATVPVIIATLLGDRPYLLMDDTRIPLPMEAA